MTLCTTVGEGDEWRNAAGLVEDWRGDGLRFNHDISRVGYSGPDRVESRGYVSMFVARQARVAAGNARRETPQVWSWLAFCGLRHVADILWLEFMPLGAGSTIITCLSTPSFEVSEARSASSPLSALHV